MSGWDALRAVRQGRAAPGRAGVLLLAYLGVFWGWYFLSGTSGALRTGVADGGYLPVEVLAIGLAVAAARRRSLGRATRQAWLLVAASLLARLWGDACWFWLEAVQQAAPFPSVADVGYVAFYPLLLAGLLRLPARGRSGAHRRLLALDLLTVTACAFVGIWYLGLSTALSQGAGSTTVILNVTYGCGDLVLLAGAARIALRGAVAAARPPMAWLLAGLGCFVLADVAFAYLSTSGSFTGGQWLDLPWVSAITLFGVAADVQRRTAATTPDSDPGGALDARRDADGVLRPSRLPYAALAGACAVLLLAAARLPLHPYGGLLLGAVLAVLTASARQLLAVHEHSRLVAQLEHAAVTDPLTGVLTRGRFYQLAELELTRAAQAGTSTGLLMIDVDHFKTVNDTHGHLAGDALLRQIAQHLHAQLRPADLLGRYGGDEFVALLPGADTAATASVAQRLLLPHPPRGGQRAGDQPAGAPGGTPLPALPAASVSIGHAAHAAPAELLALLGHADAALYAVKLAGGGSARDHASLTPGDAPLRLLADRDRSNPHGPASAAPR